MEHENIEKSNGKELPSLTVTQKSSEDGCFAYTCINDERADIRSIVDFLKHYTDEANRRIKELSESVEHLESRVYSLEAFHMRY